jgi:peptidoglycan endopeptidase LytF
MSRRDTIIISVLINAGLLTILFATAMNVEDNIDVAAGRSEEVAELAMESPSTTTKGPVVDEVDQMLKMHADEKNKDLGNTPMGMTGSATLTTNSPGLPPVVDGVITPVSKLAVGPADFDSLDGAAGKNYVEVTVKRGDYLSTIAKSNKTTVEAIMTENRLTSTSLRVGQVLRVPNAKPSSITASTVPPALNSASSTANAQSMKKAPLITGNEVADADFYIVKTGDNPWLIAQKNGMKLDELLELNSLDEHKAKKLKPGDKLRIR